jgi:hypothetical protein
MVRAFALWEAGSPLLPAPQPPAYAGKNSESGNDNDNVIAGD